MGELRKKVNNFQGVNHVCKKEMLQNSEGVQYY
ncbi:MAG: hypothetical protein K0S32_1120 [Bacteroidetes bacterium]|jgi:hypothetical protein|nr:hypothetical protein [Bacteroidota bacterium]